MSKIPLTIYVEPEAAKVYETATAGDREELNQLMSSQLLGFGSHTPRSSPPSRKPELSERTLPSEETPTRLDHDERLRRLRAGQGIWAGRTDIPSRDDFRGDWESRLQRLGQGD